MPAQSKIIRKLMGGMSGSGKPAPNPRNKSLAKPKAASFKKDEKTFKSAEFVQDSDDDEHGGEDSIGKHHASTVEILAVRLPTEKKTIQAKRTPSLQKPAQRPKAHMPSPVVDESGSDGQSSTSQLSSPDKLKSNGQRTVKNNVAAKRLSSVAKSSMKRKKSSFSDSDTGSSASDRDKSSSPLPAKRRKGSPLPDSSTSTAVNTILSAKPSRHPTSSDTDEVGEPGSTEDAETDVVSEGGSASQSQSGGSEISTLASEKRTKYGRFATNDIRDLAKSLQCRSKISPATAPIRTTSWLQVHYHHHACGV